MNIRLVYLLITFLCLNGFQFTSLAQSSVNEIKFLTEKADLILIGKVSERNSRWNKDNTRIYTDVVLNVDEYLKGSGNDDKIIVTTLGGEIGEVGELYTHMPRFNSEEDVLIFLKQDQKNMSYNVLNGEDGKLTLYEDNITGEKVTSSNKKISSLKQEIKNYVEKNDE
ncbi:MAG: hypothetical protein P8X73_05345 [Ignavibacteriaceae bacterium]